MSRTNKFEDDVKQIIDLNGEDMKGLTSLEVGMGIGRRIGLKDEAEEVMTSRRVCRITN